MEERDENDSQEKENNDEFEQDSDSDNTKESLPSAEKGIVDEQDEDQEDYEGNGEDDSQQEIAQNS